MIRILKPQAKLWLTEGISQEQFEAHVARCARVCYASERNTGNHEMVERLNNSNHRSMFRHWPMYFSVPREVFVNYFGYGEFFKNCPYIRIAEKGSKYLISTNYHYVLDHPEYFSFLQQFQITPSEMAKLEPKLLRFTFYLTTQISTTRELNRVSPNNIAEESTRYCNYSLDKFDGEVALCQPHWFELWETEAGNEVYPEGQVIHYDEVNHEFYLVNEKEEYVKIAPMDDMGIWVKKYSYGYVERYLQKFARNAREYLEDLEDYHVEPQDARGELHLDTATHVVYSYFLDEWQHIIDLRFNGTTGKPHPNAKLIVGKIYQLLQSYFAENNIRTV